MHRERSSSIPTHTHTSQRTFEEGSVLFQTPSFYVVVWCKPIQKTDPSLHLRSSRSSFTNPYFSLQPLFPVTWFVHLGVQPHRRPPSPNSVYVSVQSLHPRSRHRVVHPHGPRPSCDSRVFCRIASTLSSTPGVRPTLGTSSPEPSVRLGPESPQVQGLSNCPVFPHCVTGHKAAAPVVVVYRLQWTTCEEYTVCHKVREMFIG